MEKQEAKRALAKEEQDSVRTNKKAARRIGKKKRRSITAPAGRVEHSETRPDYRRLNMSDFIRIDIKTITLGSISLSPSARELTHYAAAGNDKL